MEGEALDRSVCVLASHQMGVAARVVLQDWSPHDEVAVRRTGARLIGNARYAADLVHHAAPGLVRGIVLASPLGPVSAMGPLWHGHPFASPAMAASYRLREPDITRGLERVMREDKGERGATRARSFLRTLAELGGTPELLAALREPMRPVVAAEHPIRVGRAPHRPDRSGGGITRGSAEAMPLPAAPGPLRIDMLFRWPTSEGRSHVVVVEAKLGSTVSAGQLAPYREEARRLARGGPVTLFLLTLRPDAAERRHRNWHAVRWGALMGRWERCIAQDGDDDGEFARLRAQVWRHVLNWQG